MGLRKISKHWPVRIVAIVGALVMGASTSSIKAANLKKGETGRIKSIVDGDTLFLESGLKVRLSGIQAPKLPLGRKGFVAWPLGDDAKAALLDLTQSRDIGLYYSGLKRDRYKRALAQVYVLDEKGQPDFWVQEKMVRMGLARVYTWPDTKQDVHTLFKAEREARKKERGIWALDYYKIRKPDPDPLAQYVDSFQIVEGIITSVANVRGQIYLNFGANYRTDFTVAIAKSGKKAFKKSGVDPLSLEGARVRVRGWIELKNGPIIWLDHPERLEVLN